MSAETDTKLTGCIFQLGFLGFFLFMAWGAWDSLRTGDYKMAVVCLLAVALILWITYNVLFEHDTPAEKEYYEINNKLHAFSEAQARAIEHMMLTGSNDWTLVNELKAQEAAFEKTIEIHSIPCHNAALRYKRGK